MASNVERILILAKTYPSPSAQYVETSCVAGVNEQGAMRRLYPVPFRMIEEGRQFQKWQWVDVRVEKANRDHRPESHRVYVDTIACGSVLSRNNEWAERWEWLDKVPSFVCLDALETARLNEKLSIGLLRPKVMLGLDVVKARNHDWTEEERAKLMREQMQGNLFLAADARQQVRTTLRKVPFDFYYTYACETPEGEARPNAGTRSWTGRWVHCTGTAGAAMGTTGRSRSEQNWRGSLPTKN